MRKISLITGILILFTGSVWAAVAELDSDLMQAVEDANKSMASNIALRDKTGSLSDATELDGMFAEIEHFYVSKGDADDAVKLSKKSRELVADILKSVNSGEFDHATNLATDLSRTCKSCHNFYKKS
ncbi:MAG: hypothetical protein J0L85_04485 [Zoogloea sp.]|nr:hypothetical protein [Zoogloea sp.]MCA0184685.1 hypothetical protein [Pseudomonadota bacterium]